MCARCSLFKMTAEILHSPTVIVAAITSRQRKAHLPIHVLLPARICGLRQDSAALLEQVRTLEKARLEKYLGCVPDSAMAQVDAALALSLGTKNG